MTKSIHFRSQNLNIFRDSQFFKKSGKQWLLPLYAILKHVSRSGFVFFLLVRLYDYDTFKLERNNYIEKWKHLFSNPLVSRRLRSNVRFLLNLTPNSFSHSRYAIFENHHFRYQCSHWYWLIYRIHQHCLIKRFFLNHWISVEKIL